MKRQRLPSPLLISSFGRTGRQTGSGDNGVTLVELLVVVSIVGILAVALGFTYQGWMGKYKVEKATKDLYSDLMTARVNAMTRQRVYFVTLNAESYSMSADVNDNEISDDPAVPPFPKSVDYPLNKDFGGNVLSFEKRGLVSPSGSMWFTTTVDPDYDCIIISSTRIKMGKMGECDDTHPGNECCAR